MVAVVIAVAVVLAMLSWPAVPAAAAPSIVGSQADPVGDTQPSGEMDVPVAPDLIGWTMSVDGGDRVVVDIRTAEPTLMQQTAPPSVLAPWEQSIRLEVIQLKIAQPGPDTEIEVHSSCSRTLTGPTECSGPLPIFDGGELWRGMDCSHAVEYAGSTDGLTHSITLPKGCLWEEDGQMTVATWAQLVSCSAGGGTCSQQYGQVWDDIPAGLLRLGPPPPTTTSTTTAVSGSPSPRPTPDRLPVGGIVLAVVEGRRFGMLAWAIDPDTRSPTTARVRIDGAVSAEFRPNFRWYDMPQRTGWSSYDAFVYLATPSPGRHEVCFDAMNFPTGAYRTVECRTITVK